MQSKFGINRAPDVDEQQEIEYSKAREVILLYQTITRWKKFFMSIRIMTSSEFRTYGREFERTKFGFPSPAVLQELGTSFQRSYGLHSKIQHISKRKKSGSTDIFAWKRP